MKRLLILLPFIASACTPAEQAITPVDFTAVSINDSFLAPRIRTNAEVTIPHSLQKCADEGRFDNFVNAAKAVRRERPGKWRGHWGFDDSDVYKVLEGMAFTFNVNHDAALDARMDSIITLIAAAQEPDGYLYTPVQLHARDYAELMCTYREERYDNLRESHELYSLGHLYEAAAAHFTATGKRNLLDIALKSADHIYAEFGPEGREAIPGHQEIELGLLKLAGISGDTRYAELAKLFLDRRGTGLDGGLAYYQNDEKVVDQKYARGHAVRANYMYTAMTRIASLTGDADYKAAVDTLWEDVVGTRMYITGGMGQVYDGEAYAAPYYLPNNSYAETCAAIAGVFWNREMFLLHGESKYYDVLERILYNGLLAGISTDGTRFFYPNPMIADGSFGFNRGNYGRTEWFDCSCCPTNDCRFISSLPGYVYATRGDEIFQNLYVASEARIALSAPDSGSRIGSSDVNSDGADFTDDCLTLTQTGNYPWNGLMTTTVNTSKPVRFTLRLRLPCWALGHPVPSGLYTYPDCDSKSEAATHSPCNPITGEPVGMSEPECGKTPAGDRDAVMSASDKVSIKIQVNGKPFRYQVQDGYAVIRRRWRDGDKVEIDLPMPVHKVIANGKVEADRGLVALERGPLVYCFEEADNGPVASAGRPLINLTGEFRPVTRSFSTGDEPVSEISHETTAEAVTCTFLSDGRLTAIPYCLWDNRGDGTMTVWLHR